MNRTKEILLTALITGCCGYYRFSQKTIVLPTTVINIETEINFEDYRLRICERGSNKHTEGMSDEARRFVLNNMYYPSGYTLKDRHDGLNKSSGFITHSFSV